jgi:hypothetical protein
MMKLGNGWFVCMMIVFTCKFCYSQGNGPIGVPIVAGPVDEWNRLPDCPPNKICHEFSSEEVSCKDMLEPPQPAEYCSSGGCSFFFKCAVGPDHIIVTHRNEEKAKKIKCSSTSRKTAVLDYQHICVMAWECQCVFVVIDGNVVEQCGTVPSYGNPLAKVTSYKLVDTGPGCELVEDTPN